MNKIPFVGQVFTKKSSSLWLEEISSFMITDRPSDHDCFSVQIGDDGLEGLNIHTGDYLIFRHQGWPTNELQLVFLQFGDECAVRILQGIWDDEPLLQVTGDRYEEWQYHRNQFIITGVFEKVVRKVDAKVVSIYD